VTNRKSTSVGRKISKSPTGIRGLDEITGGGLPTGRPTLVCGQRRLRQDAARDRVSGPRRRLWGVVPGLEGS
jgi:hypothetical protein